MAELKFTISDISELGSAAEQILQFCAGRKVFAFYADMGAGKTTLIKELCRQLGSADNFSSPTYSIVNEYHTPTDYSIYHMDLYRLNTPEDAQGIGVGEYLNGHDYCFIEWPRVIEDILPTDTVKINIQTEGNTRNVAIFMD